MSVELRLTDDKWNQLRAHLLADESEYAAVLLCGTLGSPDGVVFIRWPGNCLPLLSIPQFDTPWIAWRRCSVQERVLCWHPHMRFGEDASRG